MMIQGTGSHVGKSIAVAGLCRVFSDDGYKVAPFKSQNMSLNSCVTGAGEEIARAQELQARAARVEPTAHMNPVLLKPKGPEGSEVILRGGSVGDFTAREYFSKVQPRALGLIAESLAGLLSNFDLVVIEGAGSPAEVNLHDHDICNMKVALMASSPVLLLADIDMGGALASIVGTLSLLPRKERRAVKGIVINKFRGDRGLLEPGLEFLERRTGRRVVGVLPWLEPLHLDEEDTPRGRGAAGAPVAVVRLPYMSNFTDFEPLMRERCARWIRRPDELDGARMIVLPGTRNTTSDLRWLHESGLAAAIKGKVDEGVFVIGICGGYQMLGEEVVDTESVESGEREMEGLSLLPVVTRFERPKVTRRVSALVTSEIPVLPGLEGTRLDGYEIHTGRVEVVGGSSPLLFDRGDDMAADGSVSDDGRVFGTHLHGLFNNPEVIAALLSVVGGSPSGTDHGELVEESIARLAAAMRRELDLDYVYGLLGLG